ncbi:MAG: cupin domain-containing protein [Acidimicrobiales bacterium]|nr:cupin domain-containing protein [Acidimicrobiales bacterium]
MADPPDLDADHIADILDLRPHPEGGRFVETWRATADDGRRATGTAIYFLLRAGEESHWHRVDATEIWHHYAGAPLRLRTVAGESIEERILGPDIASGARPQLIVEPHQWQAAASLGAWTLVGCTVSPGFDFDGFELAPTDWNPPGTVEPRGG